jgi:hypothetical protein
MAVTTIFSGNTTANTPTAWVAVPAASKYTVQSVGLNFTFIEYSIDGANPFSLVTNQASTVGTASGSGFTVNTPVLWARVNPGPNAITGVLATIINI